MIDRVIKLSQHELVIIYTDGRKPFTIYDSDGNAEKLWLYMQSETTLTPTEAFRALDVENEETAVNFSPSQEGSGLAEDGAGWKKAA